MEKLTATTDEPVKGVLILEDQDGRAVGIYAPEMDAFDKLPSSVRAYMRDMINPPLASSVLEAVKVAGVRATLEILREVNLKDAVTERVA